MRSTCCLNVAFSLTKPTWPCFVCIKLHGESVAALTDQFADAFVRENVACAYDVVAIL